MFVYVKTHHIFFIHPSADGHLGGFQGMALVNSTAVNIGAHMSFQSMVFSGFMLGCGIA